MSGWIEPDELPHLTALRELREETGFEAEALFGVDAIFDIYPSDSKELVDAAPEALLLRKCSSGRQIRGKAYSGIPQWWSTTVASGPRGLL